MDSNFTFISAVPLTTLSDEISTRRWAKKRVANYRSKKSQGKQDPPPLKSVRRVYWSASVDHRRGWIERIKSGILRLLFR